MIAPWSSLWRISLPIAWFRAQWAWRQYHYFPSKRSLLSSLYFIFSLIITSSLKKKTITQKTIHCNEAAREEKGSYTFRNGSPITICNSSKQQIQCIHKNNTLKTNLLQRKTHTTTLALLSLKSMPSATCEKHIDFKLNFQAVKIFQILYFMWKGKDPTIGLEFLNENKLHKPRQGTNLSSSYC